MVMRDCSSGRTSGAWLASLCCLAALAGCGPSGPPKYAVEGQVTYQGKALPRGTVMLVPASGPAATALIQPDGTFRTKSVEGPHRVGITALEDIGSLELDAASEEGQGVSIKSLIPPSFGRPHLSGLTVDVKPQNDNRADFNLQ